MAVPKKKTSRSKRNMRRAHDSLTAPNSIICTNCGEPKLRHRVCKACGQYRGKQVIEAESAEL